MQKVVTKLDDGQTGVLYHVEKRRVFSEDFKSIVRSMMLVNVMKVCNEKGLDVDDDELLGDTLKTVLEFVLGSVPALLEDCLEQLKKSDVYTQEIADLGFRKSTENKE